MKTYPTSTRKLERMARQQEELEELACRYVHNKFTEGRSGDVRVKDGRIEEELNTACHCHPEYRWTDRGSLEDLANWLKR
jgi:hypothetical protein